jgi:hypothetical protein
MSEEMAAEIWIGGKVAASLVPGLCAAIAQQYVSLEWGDSPFCPGTAKELLAACRENDQEVRLLWLCDHQARFGELEHLEQFLREHQIAFTRRGDGKYEYDPLIAEYRPQEGLFVVLSANHVGEAVVPAYALASVETALTEAVRLAQADERQKACSLAETALQALRERLPPKLPPLEPFEIAVDQPPEASHGQ